MDADPLTEHRAAVARVQAAVHRNRSDRITAKAVLDPVRDLVQSWFRVTRGELAQRGVPDEALAGTDAAMQSLLRLTSTRSRRSQYVALLTRVRDETRELDVQQELAISAAAVPPTAALLGPVETRIVATLRELAPSAAVAYEQAVRDLADPNRLSYRGAATELRQTLWDVLDRLAPDDAVTASPGFRLEKDRDKPTHKQKARYIFRSRNTGATAREAPEASMDALEERVGALARAVYGRTSQSTHGSTDRNEVQQVKLYADSVLAELLEIHRSA